MGRRTLNMIAAGLIGLALTAPAAMAQNVAQISSVQKGSSCPGCNLFQADLSNKTLKGVNLSHSRLRQADLSLSTMSLHVSTS